ncbi:hypothetical protein [Nocardioides sp. SR21]|uniref:hypothetical protein n=1 Tax=Nocardioides sp. SR21 TaxID=2919501 RepID=UPI001FA9521C|nr:hypothetical protein [Nocardioides sp. SR21]
MALLVIAPFPEAPASASCAAPYLMDAEGRVLQRGATTTVEGRAFVNGCQDSMSCSAGCHACEYDSPPETPIEDVRLQLAQDGRTWDLDVADAGTERNDQFGWVTWTFAVPADATPGRARLIPEHGEPASIRIR